MTRLFEGISSFFARRRRHCSLHEVYEADCPACVALNRRRYVDSGTVQIVDTDGDGFLSNNRPGVYVSSSDSASDDRSGPYSPSIFNPSTDSASGDSSGGDGSSADSSSSYGSGADSSSSYGSGADSSTADNSTADSSSCTTSDFGGFDGGASGGGGAREIFESKHSLSDNRLRKRRWRPQNAYLGG